LIFETKGQRVYP
jgi:acetyl esterase